LFQISLAAKLNKPYVYLGYWIENCQKMSYKKKYQPIEFFKENSWELSE
jgi:arginine-tRNA-protein transferase